MTDCIFCKIIEGEIPSAKVYEDDKVMAFLDLSQVTLGHTLVIPKKHVENVFEYDGDVSEDLAIRIPVIARAIKEAFPESKGLNIVNNNGEVAYQTVFHSHWHLIPRYEREEGFAMQFTNNQETYDQDEFNRRAETIAQKIHNA
ncbi:HIT family protein [Aerococcaceae bacterium WGS1372]